MKVFKFIEQDNFYAISGESEESARECLDDLIGGLTILSVEEIPESEWDEKFIEMHEDNDTSTEPFYMSIREMITKTPELIFTNDIDLID